MMENNSIVMEDSNENLLKLAASVDDFEGYEHPHGARIAALSEYVGREFNIASHDLFSLKQAALVHDIGEMTMNREYIRINRLLTVNERVDMQRHPVIGEQEAARSGFSRAVQLLVRWHHEWWNGSGYPDALEQEQIPLAARILRVCDTFSALTDSRPYSSAISAAEAKRYLIEWAGIEFDPQIVKVFLSLKDIPELESFSVNSELQ